MLVTVISQSSGSEVEEEEEEEGGKDDTSNTDESSERSFKLPQKTEVKLKNGSRGPGVTRKCSTKTNAEAIGSQDEGEISEILISCMKRNLRVVVPRLNVSNGGLPVQLNRLAEEKDGTSSPGQPNSKDKVANRDSVQRKRRFIDLSPTPEKHLTISVNKL